MHSRNTGIFLLFTLLLFSSCTLAQNTSTPHPALLVGEKSGASMAIVDPSTFEVVAHLPANENPHEIATDGRYAYISNSGASFITVIDLEAQEQVEGIDLRPMGAIHSLSIAEGRLYFANETARTISRYDLDTQTIDRVFGTGLPRAHMLTVSEDATKIFTTSMTAEVAAIIEQTIDDDGDGSWDMTVIPTGPRAEGLDLSPDGSELWVNNVTDSTISIIDVASKQEIEKIQLPTTFSNRLMFTPDGQYVFVSELQGDSLLVLDAETRQQVKRIDTGGGTEGLMMSPDGTRAFAAVSPEGKVAVIDLETLEVIGEITGLSTPDGMAWIE